MSNVSYSSRRPSSVRSSRSGCNRAKCQVNIPVRNGQKCRYRTTRNHEWRRKYFDRKRLTMFSTYSSSPNNRSCPACAECRQCDPPLQWTNNDFFSTLCLRCSIQFAVPKKPVLEYNNEIVQSKINIQQIIRKNILI